MIIGISGKIGSGKDLVGEIIQYLTSNYYKSGYSFEYFRQQNKKRNDYPLYLDWQIKKYADKLKDIICLLLGCTIEQWENDRNFRETPLGEEWWYYKGEVGIYPYNTPYEANKKLPLIKPTPRDLIQLIGTDLFRNQLHPLVWINATMAEYQPISGTMDVRKSRETLPNWVITDMRFPNELEAVKSRGGITIRVNNPWIRFSDGSYRAKSKMLGDFDNEHESETALDDYEFDYVIDNNGTIEELIIKIKDILIERGVL
jgi:hypothetical protein